MHFPFSGHDRTVHTGNGWTHAPAAANAANASSSWTKSSGATQAANAHPRRHPSHAGPEIFCAATRARFSFPWQTSSARIALMEMSVAPPNTKSTRRMFSTGRARLLAVLAVVIIVAGIAGWTYRGEIERAYGQWRNELPRRVWQRLESAKSATLYSLYPELVRSPEKDMPWLDGMSRDELLALPRFRGYPILGKFECSDPSLLKRIAGDLREGTQREGSPFMCFLPRTACSCQTAKERWNS